MTGKYLQFCTAATWQYTPPELIGTEDPARPQNATEKVDMWAIGCVFLEILRCATPFVHILDSVIDSRQRETLRQCYLQNRLQKECRIPTGLPPRLRMLVKSCLNFDSEARPSASELLEVIKVSKEPLLREMIAWQARWENMSGSSSSKAAGDLKSLDGALSRWSEQSETKAGGAVRGGYHMVRSTQASGLTRIGLAARVTSTDSSNAVSPPPAMKKPMARRNSVKAPSEFTAAAPSPIIDFCPPQPMEFSPAIELSPNQDQYAASQPPMPDFTPLATPYPGPARNPGTRPGGPELPPSPPQQQEEQRWYHHHHPTQLRGGSPGMAVRASVYRSAARLPPLPLPQQLSVPPIDAFGRQPAGGSTARYEPPTRRSPRLTLLHRAPTESRSNLAAFSNLQPWTPPTQMYVVPSAAYERFPPRRPAVYPPV
eukprot:Protomagalhaensia_sp_Gyna_25__835@NODE_1401_length_1869_cov_16_376503_g1129_i0_p1_GENE_NODE_1401_length_1869_cov_16_376503_g1129_i0NODE_1401_length_1869_cov_16_376503_g1129_i0_p1_ORF_typecomplete_len428_score49_83Pkinase/PF00069_25/5_9e15Pkinase_Tyr/PF07714_17/8_2e12Kinaselike/PF14531_6/6_7e05Kinaselike/PF14531_6/4_4e03_NODE_1401_length_1869_cov_16_376503_g1129_i02261509